MAAAKAKGQPDQAHPPRAQQGSFVMGMVVGLLVGLGVALVVALYITKAPIPFIDKVPQRTAEQDAAEAERNKTWDPNGPLAGKNPARPQAPASAAEPASGPGAVPAATPGTAPGERAIPPGVVLPPPVAERPASAAARAPRDPAAILAGQADAPPAAKATPREAASAPRAEAAVQFYVQAGAFSTPQDADAQRAKLALMGLTAKVMEREQAGRTMYRVRLGPYDNRNSAEDVQDKLATGGIDANLVRVER